MYCSACGKEVFAGLTFCNHCGFKLGETKSEARKSDHFSESLVWAIVSIFIVGFGCILALLALMKYLDFKEELIGIVMLFSFVTIVFIEAMFIRFLFKHNRSPKELSGPTPARAQPVKELYTAPAAAARALGGSEPHPIPSVTEHTTRTLEPAFNAPKNDH